MSGAPSAIRLVNETLGVELDRHSGALIRLGTADGGWPILDRPALGQSFRLLVPLPGRRHNYVDGLDQAAARVSESAETVTFEWDTVHSEHGGEHAIAVRLRVSALERGIVFVAEVDNRSDLVVENVHYPCLADLRPPDVQREFGAVGHFPGGARRTVLWPRFDNAMGFCSVEHPTFANVPGNALGAVGAPVTPFLLLDDGRRGLYWGVDEPSAELVAWHGELHPGWSDSLDSRVAPGLRVGGHDVSVRLSAVHLPYVLPGQSRRLTGIAIQPYVGDWHAGADLYRERRRDWMDEPAGPAWTREPHSWQQIQLNSSEDTLRVQFADLPGIARECADRGVTALQLVGWNDGGQDRNNPCHDPDPRLGGAEALGRAIAECRRLGVKVVLFAKFVWADRASERFREDLVDLAVKDPYGDYYVFPGFRYDTATQLLDVNTRRLIPMCFADDRWFDVCAQEFAKMVELGADGMLNDEALHHTPAFLCFDASHSHRWGAPVYARDREFVRYLQRGPGAGLDDYLYAAEACYDWLFEVYHLSYHRSNTSRHIPLTRYLRPDAPIMTAVTGFDDRNMVNHCLVYRYIASYEPHLFKGRLTDFDLTIGYGREMDSLRTELREWFWDGTFRDTVGAAVVDAAGEDHHPYAVYLSARNGVPGVALANYDTRPVELKVRIDGGATGYRSRLVDDDTWRDASDAVVLPPRSAGVVIPTEGPDER